MSSPLCAFRGLALSLSVGVAPLMAQLPATLSPQGSQFSLVGSHAGDQVVPQAAFGAAGGFVVWHDNNTDGDGLGISARRLGKNLAAELSNFRVNESAAGDQENPQVGLLRDGGAAFVWQGGLSGQQDVYLRILRADGTFATGDIRVNEYTRDEQVTPVLAVLADGNLVIAWASFGQDGSQYGVYARRFTATGQPLSSEERVNAATLNSQRSPALAALRNGGYVIGWTADDVGQGVVGVGTSVTAEGAVTFTSNLLASTYDAQGQLVRGEFRLNAAAVRVAHPVFAPVSSGGFVAAWSGWNETARVLRGNEKLAKGWDVFARVFTDDGASAQEELRVNSYTLGDQFAPRLAEAGGQVLVAWSSLGQEGFRQGVYARALALTGAAVGDEFRVNVLTSGAQMYPSVASDGSGRFLVSWSGPTSGLASYDLFGQRYGTANPLLAPPTPFVSALSQSRLLVTWPEVAGYPVASYELFIDDAATPVTVTGIVKEIGSLAPGSTHRFKLAYRLADGRVSESSDAVSGTTWSEDQDLDGLPDDWQGRFWPAGNRPGSGADSDGDGANNAQEFLAGTDPTNPADVLRTRLSSGEHGVRLHWNARIGNVYQVQQSRDLRQWEDLGSPRFAAGAEDSAPVPAGDGVGYYRVIRVR